MVTETLLQALSQPSLLGRPVESRRVARMPMLTPAARHTGVGRGEHEDLAAFAKAVADAIPGLRAAAVGEDFPAQPGLNRGDVVLIEDGCETGLAGPGVFAILRQAT